jgi:hypothetical protein
VTTDGFWIDDRIYWTLIELNYKQLRQSHWVTYTKDHCNHSTPKVFSGFLSRCLVAASYGGHSPSSVFLNCLRASATSFSQQHLARTKLQQYSNSLLTGTPFLIVVGQLLPSKHVCFRSRYSVTAVVYLLISRSLPSNGSTCNNATIELLEASFSMLSVSYQTKVGDQFLPELVCTLRCTYLSKSLSV